MQEEIIQKTLAIIMRAEQIGEQQMRQAFQKVLTDLEQGRRKMPGTDRTGHHGKRSLRELQSGGAQLTNVEITDDNMKSFEKYAREYGIDYSLKVNRHTDPPRWYMFFRAKDEKVMEAAFREYVNDRAARQERPSVRQKLAEINGRLFQERNHEKQRERFSERDR